MICGGEDMNLQNIKTWDELLLELARIAKKNGSSKRVRVMYAKNYNRILQRKKA
jgi:hypothetical protein